MRRTKGKARILAVLLSACMLVQPMAGTYAAETGMTSEDIVSEEVQGDENGGQGELIAASPVIEKNGEPTAEPSEDPVPTVEPSEEPTETPSAEPTALPENGEEQPSVEPGMLPEEDPTVSPEPSVLPSMTPDDNLSLVKENGYKNEDINSISWDAKGNVVIDSNSIVGPTYKCKLEYINPDTNINSVYYTDSDADDCFWDSTVSSDYVKGTGYFKMAYLISEDGTYKATISIDDTDEEPVELVYTRPSKALAQPTNFRMNGNILAWDAVQGDVCGYTVRIYKDNEIKDMKVLAEGNGDDISNPQINLENYLNEAGECRVTVRAISGDISKTANSSAGEFTKTVDDYIESIEWQGGKVVVTLKEKMKDIIPVNIDFCFFPCDKNGNPNGSRYEYESIDEYQKQVIVDFSQYIQRDGIYESYIQFWDRKNQKNITSETIRFTYQKPKKELPKVTGLQWKDKSATWNAVNDSNVSGYLISLYRQDVDRDMEINTCLVDAETLTCDFSSQFEDNDTMGDYFFTVTAISTDITKIANSQVSAKSPIYTNEKDVFEVALCDEQGGITGDVAYCASLDKAFEIAKGLQGAYKSINYRNHSSYKYRTSDTLVIPDVGGKLFLSSDFGDEGYNYSAGIYVPSIKIENTEVEITSLSVRKTRYEGVDINLNGHKLVTSGNFPVGVLSGSGTFISNADTSINWLNGDMEVEVDGNLYIPNISNTKSTAKEIRILNEGILNLYQPLSVNDLEGNVYSSDYYIKKNKGPLLTLTGKLKGHTNFIIAKNYGSKENVYPTDLAVCKLAKANTDDKDFSASYDGESGKNLAVAVQNNTIYVSNCWLSQEEVSVDVGERVLLELKGTKTGMQSGQPDTISGNDMKTIAWTSSNDAVAIVDKNGLVEGIGQGEADIYATISGRARLTCHVTVTSTLKKISLSKTGTRENPIVLEYTTNSKAFGYVTSEDQLKVFFTPADQTEIYENSVQWTSSDETVATVENGLVKAGKQNGLVEITATVTISSTGEEVTASSWYKVVESKINPEPEELTILKNDSRYKTLADLSEMLSAVSEENKNWGWKWSGTPSKVKLSDSYKTGGNVFPVEYQSPDTGKVYYSEVTVYIESATSLELRDQENEIVGSTSTIQMVDAESTLELMPECKYEFGGETTTSYKIKVDKPGLLSAEVLDKNGVPYIKLSTKGKAGTAKLTVEAYGRLGNDEHETLAISKVYTFKIVDCSKGIAQIGYKIKSVEDDTELAPVKGTQWSFELSDSQNKYYLDAYDTDDESGARTANFTISCKSDNEKVIKIEKEKKTGRLLLKPIAAGNAEIVMTANDACKTQEKFQVTVKDSSAKSIAVSTAKVTINSAREESGRYADITVYYGADTENLELSLTDKSGNAFVNSVAEENITVEKLTANGDMIARIWLKSSKNVIETKKAKPYLKIEGNGAEKLIPLTVTISNAYPSISVKQARTLDLVNRIAAEFEISAGDQTKITSCTLQNDDDFELTDGAMLDLKDGGNVKKKVVFVIALEGYAKPVVTKAVAVKTTSTAYKLSSTSGTVFTDVATEQVLQTQILEAGKQTDLFGSTIEIKDNKGNAITGLSVALESNGVVKITATDNANVKKQKIYLTVSGGKLRKAVKLTYEIKTAKVESAKLKLKSETLNLYSYAGLDVSTATATALEITGASAELVKEVSLSPADQKTREIWNKELVLTYNDIDQKISAALNDYKGSKIVTYQVKVSVKVDGLKKPLQKTLKVKVNPINEKGMKNLVTVKTKGQLDVYNADSYVTVTTKYSNLPAGYTIQNVAFDDMSVAESWLELVKISDTEFRIYADDYSGLSSLKANLVYTIGVNGGKESEKLTVRTGELNIKLTNGKLKTKMTGRTVFNNMGSEQTGQWKLSVKNSKGEEVSVSEAYVSGIYANDFEVNLEENTITHTGNSVTRTGKKYELPIVVELENSLAGTKPMTLKYKIEIK